MEMPWFMWKGELSPDRGVTVGEYPPVARAGLRAERVRLPGRCGSLTLPGAAYDPVTVAMTVLVMPGTPPETVLAWLSGEGELILGNDPRRSRRAMMREPLCLRELPGGWFGGEARFECQPLKAQVPPEGDIALTAAEWGSGEWEGVYNPGDVTARPVFRLEGTGCLTLTWDLPGRTDPPRLTVDLRDAAWAACGGAVFDSGTLRVTTPDGAAGLDGVSRLENGEAEDFGLKPGRTRLIPASTGGSVGRLTLTPRWRWL